MSRTAAVHKPAPGYLEIPGTGISAVRRQFVDGYGWVISDDTDRSYSDPIRTERQTRHTMLCWRNPCPDCTA